MQLPKDYLHMSSESQKAMRQMYAAGGGGLEIQFSFRIPTGVRSGILRLHFCEMRMDILKGGRTFTIQVSYSLETTHLLISIYRRLNIISNCDVFLLHSYFIKGWGSSSNQRF